MKVLLHYLTTSRGLTQKPDTILIPNPLAIQLACSLWKLLGSITGVQGFTTTCLGMSLFAFVVLDTWRALSVWRQLSFNLGPFSCIINFVIPVFPFLCFIFSLDCLYVGYWTWKDLLYFLSFLFYFPSYFDSTFWAIALTLYDDSFIPFLKFQRSYSRFPKSF